MQQRHQKLKTQNLKTQYTFNGTLCELQFGKPVRLPYIKKARYSNKNEYLSNEKQISRIQKPLQSNLDLSSQLNLMTLQQIQLTQQQQSLQRKKSYSKFLPKINFNLKKQKSSPYPSQIRMQRMNSQQSITKIQFWQRLQNYNIGPILGRGSYSIVRLAKNHQRKKFAIKIYQKNKLLDGDRKKNLQRQIQILYQISHPNLLKFYQTIYKQQNHVSLAQYMKTQSIKKFQQNTLKLISKQIFSAFDYLHKKDIVHRDIKMQNIMIDSLFNLKIIDFGFSVKISKGEVLYDFCGTPHYIAPEVIKKKGYYGKQADVWSLGVLIYKLAVGNFPFKGINEKNLFNKIVKGDLKINQEEISQELKMLIIKIMQIDWEKRPTIQDILQDKWFVT